MHENRETSAASRSDEDRDRSAKAPSDNAGAHAAEGSDCAVVPVNQPNKGDVSLAEVGEERAQIEENIVRSNTSPTQSGERVSQGLSGVRQAARERRQERFTALLNHLTVGLLRDSYYALKRQAAPGVDGVTWKQYETGLEERLIVLTAWYIAERTGHSPLVEFTSRRLTGGNVRWASRHWRTRLFNRPW